MIRRVSACASVLAGLGVLSACSTIDKPAATVNGVDIAMADFADEVKLLENGEFGQQSVGFGAPGSSFGETTRNWLTFRVIQLAATEIVAETGTPLPEDQVSEATAAMAQAPGWDALPAELQTVIVDGLVARQVLTDQLQGKLSEADVDIASAIGTWNSDSLSIVPAGL